MFLRRSGFWAESHPDPGWNFILYFHIWPQAQLGLQPFGAWFGPHVQVSGYGPTAADQIPKNQGFEKLSIGFNRV